MKKFLCVFGTRPEVIKLFPVIKELKSKKGIEVKVCVTAQHREMLDEFLRFFRIKPDYDLNIMEENQTSPQIGSKVFSKLEKVLKKEKPNCVIVQGDTTTAAISALTAFYNKIKIVHVEAGLRSFNKWSPFPEEINRKIISIVADYHFAPTKKAKENLLKEGIEERKIYVTGNPVIDTLKFILKTKKKNDHPFLKSLKGKKIILVTAHRRENFGKPLENICYSLKEISKLDNIHIVYPVHLNPNVWNTVHRILSKIENISLIKPLDYFSLVSMMKKSYLILTDSGGIQEEAPSLGKPVLVLREVTERPEGIEAGTAKLVGTDKENIIRETLKLLKNKKEYEKMAKAVNPYGDGRASKRIANILLKNN
jgi:UDP-N-acetylglucosamine 2-epimerase (non-hydrolysing)